MVQLSDLIGAEVRRDTERLGHVGDVRVVRRADATWEVEAILLGPSSMLERLGLRRGAPEEIAWTRVREIRDGIVTVVTAG